MVKFNARVNNSNPKLVKDLEETIIQSVYDLADQVFAVSQEKVPRDKGTLADSGFVKHGPGARSTILYTAAHAIPVHEGTKPHEIRAKNAPALSFIWPRAPPEMIAKLKGVPTSEWGKRVRGVRKETKDGKTGYRFFFKKVEHPGTKAQRFLQEALDEVAPTFPDIFRDRIKVTLKR